MKTNLDKILRTIKVTTLSNQERDQVWRRIHASINEPVFTHNFLSKLIYKPMIPIALIVALIFGGSVATVVASDSAKPGDLLFPLDRAIENIQIKFSSDEKKDELKLKFAYERVEEVEEIISESVSKKENNDIDIDSSTSDTATSTTATTTDPARDRKQEQITQAFAKALEYIATVKLELAENGNTEAVEAIDSIIDQLDNRIDTLPENIKIEIEQEKDKRKVELEIEIRDGEKKIKFESEGNKSEYESEGPDGKVKIKVEDDGRIKIEREDREDDEDKDDDKDKDSDDDNRDDKDALEVEAEIKSGKTTIKVELNNKKHFITTSATTRDEIISAVVNEFDVTREDVGRTLKIEYEDRQHDENSTDEIDENDESGEYNDDSAFSGPTSDDTVHGASNSSNNDESDNSNDTPMDASGDDVSTNSENSSESSSEQTSDSDEEYGESDEEDLSVGLQEAKAEVDKDETKIKVKIDEQEYEYTISASTRDAVIDDISVRYAIDRSLVNQILVFEIESE